jgi:hypothetical protein
MAVRQIPTYSVGAARRTYKTGCDKKLKPKRRRYFLRQKNKLFVNVTSRRGRLGNAGPNCSGMNAVFCRRKKR